MKTWKKTEIEPLNVLKVFKAQNIGFQISFCPD